MDRAIGFYEGVLGLKLLRREGRDWAELRGRGHGPRPLGRARHEAAPGGRHGRPARLRHRRRRGPPRRAATCSAARVEDMGGAKTLAVLRPRRQRDRGAPAAGRLALGAPPRGPAAGLRDRRDEPLDVLGPDRERLAVHFSGARTSIGSVSSSTAAGPDAPTKATRPRAMRTPTPPHQGQSMVPTLAMRSIGMSAAPSRPIRSRSHPSSTTAAGRPGASGTRKGRAQRLRRIGNVGTRRGGYAAGGELPSREETSRRRGRRRWWHDDGGTGRTRASRRGWA